MMKKQFFRVKQLADQTFLKADKSEVLNNEELIVADQKIEYLKTSIAAINKKIVTSQGIDVEKRTKKTTEYQLGSVFLEQSQKKKDTETSNSRNEEDCYLFQQMLKEAGEVFLELANDFSSYDSKVEELVTNEFQKILENEFPNIFKQKRNLTKYLLDLDSATHRYQSTKKEAVKDDMEEADSKVEQSRDALAIEMFSLLARENEFSGHILQLLKLQRAYHESAFKTLEKVIPELEKKIGESCVKKVFGIPLKEHLKVTGRRIAYPLQISISILSHLGLNEEGLLRIAGGSTKVKRLKASIDSGCFSNYIVSEYRDVHVIASILKLYLRELPEPLLTYSLHDSWMECMTCDNKLEVIRSLLSKLPDENYENLTYLIQFLSKLSQNHENNKMNSSNIAIVMAPSLLWKRNEMDMNNYVSLNMLVEFFIKEVQALFPMDVSKYVTFVPIFPEEEERNSMFSSVNISNSESIAGSPKPISRKKKPAAPVPPSCLNKTDQDTFNNRTLPKTDLDYALGSSTLTRPTKPKEVTKTSVGVNTFENSLSISQGKILKKEDSIEAHNKTSDLSKPVTLVNQSDDKENAEVKFTTEPVAVNVQYSKPQPIKTVSAQTLEDGKCYTTTAVHQVGYCKTESFQTPKPVAAPRTNINNDGTSSTTSDGVTTNLLVKTDSFNKLQCESFGDVQLRKVEPIDRSNKPAVPVRPSSLQKPISSDLVNTGIHKTQCILSNVANKQQPSLVNLQNRNEKFQPGHDNQIAEKEKFLYSQHDKNKIVPLPRTSLENKFNDANSNCSYEKSTLEKNQENIQKKHIKNLVLNSSEQLSSSKSSEKLNVTKSNEKLNESNVCSHANQKLGHARTQSDGNIIGLSNEGSPSRSSVPQTPTSPRTLNKPSQPPPPPPVNKTREPDSTDL